MRSLDLDYSSLEDIATTTRPCQSKTSYTSAVFVAITHTKGKTAPSHQSDHITTCIAAKCIIPSISYANARGNGNFDVVERLLLLALKRSLLVVPPLVLGHGRLLVLLVLGDEVVHVGLGLGELHLVHALARVPMQEGLATEHGGELVADALEELLDGGAVADEGGAHLEAARWDGAQGRLHVVRDPLDEVGRVLVLHVTDLVLDFLHGDFAAVDGGAGEVASVAEVAGGHHVLRVEDLLGQLGDGDGTEGVRATAGEWCEADHEEVETREGHHVDGELAKITVELTWEAQAGGDARHDGGDEVVQIAVAWVVELQRAHADVVERLIVDAEGLIRVLNKLVDGEGGVVGLNNSVGDFGRWDDGEGGHHAVWELLTDLADEERAHTSAGTTTKRVGDLEALKAVTALSLATDDIEDLVDQLGTLGVVTLGPVVASTRLTEDEVVGAEELTEWAGADSVHGARLQVDEDGAGDILVAGCLVHVLVLAVVGWCGSGERYLVEVDVHALELEVGRAIVPVVHQRDVHVHRAALKHTRRRHQGRARLRCSARRPRLSGCPSHVVNTHPHFSWRQSSHTHWPV